MQGTDKDTECECLFADSRVSHVVSDTRVCLRILAPPCPFIRKCCALVLGLVGLVC
jgi:hypothetical protein